VLLQPMREDPPPGAKCKDKFLVQSTLITPEKETVSLQDIWTLADGEGDGKIHQQKIKVVYLPPEGEALEEVDEGGQSHYVEEGNSHYASTLPPSNGHVNVLDTFVPIHRPSSPVAGQERSPSPGQGEYIIAHEDTTQHETHYGDAPSAPGVVNINVHSPGPVDDSNVRYAEAQEEISRLRALVNSLTSANQDQGANNLRRRTRALTEDGSFIGDSAADDETVVERSGAVHENGVPLQVVIIIAIGVFVTTYLFF